jgi:hypothetical protein
VTFQTGGYPHSKRKFIVLGAALAVIALGLLIFGFVSFPLVKVRLDKTTRPSEEYVLFAPIVDDLGYAPEKASIICLMDLGGRVVHTWSVLGAVQLAKLQPDGNLLYATRDRSFEQRAGLRELDAFGNGLWFYGCRIDHDFSPLPNGNILIHSIADIKAPAVGPGEVRSPRIIEVTPEKQVVWEWRGEEHIAELTEILGIQFPLPGKGGRSLDWAHNNSCHVIGENESGQTDGRFKTGNILISYPNLNTVAVIDRDSGQIVWAWGPGELDGQHSPSMLENGHILMFDNGTGRGYSRIIELDPLSNGIVWEYKGSDSASSPFFSKYMSGVQLLPSGNFFVCLSEYSTRNLFLRARRAFFKRILKENLFMARLLEVGRDKEIVWDCILTSHGRDMQNLYQASRYEYQYVKPLLEKIKALPDSTQERLKSLPYVR